MYSLQETLLPGELIYIEKRLSWIFLIKPGLIFFLCVIFGIYTRYFSTDLLEPEMWSGVFVILWILLLYKLLRDVIKYFNSKIWITNKRIVIENWGKSIAINKFGYNNIKCVIMDNTFWGNIFNFWKITLVFESTNWDIVDIYFTINNPNQIKSKIIAEILEKNET